MNTDVTQAVITASADCDWLAYTRDEPSACASAFGRALEASRVINGCAIWTLAAKARLEVDALPGLSETPEAFDCLYRTAGCETLDPGGAAFRIGGVGWLQLALDSDMPSVDASVEANLLTFSLALDCALSHQALRRERAQREYAESRLGELRARGDGATSYRAMGHDFNNILTSILGFAELARAHLADGDLEEIRGYLGEVRIAGERGRDAVTALLAFARGGADARAINIAAPVAETVRLAAGMMPRDVALELTADSEALPGVSIDADDIGQICLQLCVRGRRQRRSAGVVRLALALVGAADFVCNTCGERSGDGEWVRLSVVDDFQEPPDGDLPTAAAEPATKGISRPADTLSSGGVEDLVHRHRGHLLYTGHLNRDRKVEVYLPVARLRSASV